MVSVVLADDAPLIRAGVALVLQSAGMLVLEQVGDGDALREAVERHRPDVVVTDVRMPPTGTTEGLRAAVEVQRAHPGTGVLVLSNHVETRYLASLVDHAGAGVGYLLKERVLDTASFVAAVSSVAGGGTVVDPLVVDLLLARRTGREVVGRLSPRERVVLAEMATGASNAALARSLELSVKTVETHIASIFRKMRLHEDSDEHRRVKAVLAHLDGG